MVRKLKPLLLPLVLLLVFCACERKAAPPSVAVPENRPAAEAPAPAPAPAPEATITSDRPVLRVLSCPGLKPVVEKVVERLKLETRMPPVEVAYLPSENHPEEIVKGALRYNVLLTEGKENWKLLAERGLTREKDGISLARDRVVFVALQNREIENNDPVKFLAGLPDIRIAISHPFNTLAGIHEQQSLIRMGLWKKDERKGLWLDDGAAVAAALTEGRADAAALYHSQATQHAGLKILFAAPESSHFSIVYYGLHIKGSGLREAARFFLVELSGPDSGADWRAAGFLPPPPDEP